MSYTAPLKDMLFDIEHLANIAQVAELPGFEEAGLDTAQAVLDECAAVGVDSKDQVYVFNRGEHPMIVFDKEGKFLKAWGEGVFTVPHGIFIDQDDQDAQRRHPAARGGTHWRTTGSPAAPRCSAR